MMNQEMRKINYCAHEGCKEEGDFHVDLESFLCPNHAIIYGADDATNADKVFIDQVEVNGMIKNPLKRGKWRNNPCLCGSKQKVKVCCGVQVWVPANLGKFWLASIAGDKFIAKHYAEAWEKQMKEAHDLIATAKKEAHVID